MTKPKLPPAGNFSPAPPGAPHETSQPLAPAAVHEQLALAAQNERTLAPLDFGPKVAPPPIKGVSLAPSQAVPDPEVTEVSKGGQKAQEKAGGPAQDVTHPGTPSPGLAEAPQIPGPPSLAEAPPQAAAQPTAAGEGGAEVHGSLEAEFNGPKAEVPVPDSGAPRRPAESNTDSPSRGQPKFQADPGKQVTGGWGADGGGQYFALDGLELAQVADQLFFQLKQQIKGDLRFGLACVYPQVRLRLLLQVDGVDPGAAVNEQKFDLGATRVLDLVERMQDDDATPADALRDQAGLLKPRKQLVQAGATRIMVDIPNLPL